MNDADLLKPYPDQAAEKLIWGSHQKPMDLKRVRVALRAILAEHGQHSIKLKPELDGLITHYFDTHGSFERVSDAPAWVLRVKRHRDAGP